MKLLDIRNTILLFGLLLTIVMVYSINSSYAAGIDTNLINSHLKINSSVHVTNIDPVIKNSTDNWLFLLVNNYRKQTLLDQINNSSVSKKDKDQQIQFMKELWTKYPIKFIENGTTTFITFDLENTNVKLTSDEDQMLKNIFMTNTSTSANTSTNITYTQSNNNQNLTINDETLITPLWSEPTHISIIGHVMKELGYSNTDTQLANDSAGDPDTWPVPPLDIPGIPFSIPGWENIIHSWTHYYDPDHGWGFAPEECDDNAQLAKSNYYTDHQTSMIQIGYASHFITDVGNPLHTGQEAVQIADYINAPNDIHDRYETYVTGTYYNENNQSPEYFSSDDASQAISSVTKDQMIYGDPQDLTISAATYSHIFTDTIVAELVLDPNWKTNSDLKAITQNLLEVNTAFTMGMVEYIGLPGYSDVKVNNVAGSVDGILSDYQVKYIVHSGSGIDNGQEVYLNGQSQSWPNDIRFTNSVGSLLNYWIESYDSNTATIWVKVDSIPASPGSASINIYYGRQNDPGASSGDNTFPFFDHFPGTSISLSKWDRIESYGSSSVSSSEFTVTGGGVGNCETWMSKINIAQPMAVRVRVMVTADTNYFDVGLSTYGVSTTNRATVTHDGAKTYTTQKGVLGVTTIAARTPTMTTYNVYDITINNGVAKFYYNNTLDAVINTNVPSGSMSARITGWGPTHSVVCDWILLRKYTPNEPGQTTQQLAMPTSNNIQINLTGTQLNNQSQTNVTTPISNITANNDNPQTNHTTNNNT